jgi:3-phenylpropionate/trans-cinnamate dioxygenase ferredoxin component
MSAHWVDAGPASAVRESRAHVVDVGEFSVVITRCGNDYYAIEDRCTHDGESLAVGDIEDCEIVCPRHFARFCLKTGAALSPPAYEPVRTFAVRIENGRLLLEVPD